MSDAANEVPEEVRMMDYFMHLEYHELVCPIVLTYAAALMEGSCAPLCGCCQVVSLHGVAPVGVMFPAAARRQAVVVVL